MRFLCGLTVIAALIFVVVRTARFLHRKSRWNHAFVTVGRRYNGQDPTGGVSHGYLFAKPRLRLRYRDHDALVFCRRSHVFGTGTVTLVRLFLGRELPDFELTTGELQWRNNVGAEDRRVRWDNAALDQQYRAAAPFPKRVRPLLNHSAVQWPLEELRRHGERQELYVACRRGILEINKPGFIDQTQQLDDFVRFSLQLYDQMMLAMAEGISFVNDHTAAVVDDVKCPICSETILHEMVMCTRCKTPHCRDCWQYNGQCATFACNETRFLEVGSAEI